MTLNLCTGFGITLYWLLVFAGVFPVEEIVPGYKNWFMSFPVADFWIAVCAFLSFKYLKSNDDKAILSLYEVFKDRFSCGYQNKA